MHEHARECGLHGSLPAAAAARTDAVPGHLTRVHQALQPRRARRRKHALHQERIVVAAPSIVMLSIHCSNVVPQHRSETVLRGKLIDVSCREGFA